METKAPAQQALRNRKLTHWQDNFSKYIYQETGYVPDLQTLKLAMLLQKQYRSSPWNRARLAGSDGPEPLPELPYILDEIRAHIPEKATLPALPSIEAREDFDRIMAGREGKPEPVAGITGAQARFIERSIAEWDALKREMGPFWGYRRTDPLEWVFTPEPQPDPAVVAKLESKIAAAKNKAGRRRPQK